MDWLIWAIEWLEVVAHWIWIFIVGTTVLYVVAMIVLLPVYIWKRMTGEVKDPRAT